MLARRVIPPYCMAARLRQRINGMLIKNQACCRLVEEYPDRALSWFAVGCYYLCTHQHDKARRYFGKATTMENNFAAAWIGFGNAFAFQDESDQVCFLMNLRGQLLAA